MKIGLLLPQADGMRGPGVRGHSGELAGIDVQLLRESNGLHGGLCRRALRGRRWPEHDRKFADDLPADQRRRGDRQTARGHPHFFDGKRRTTQTCQIHISAGGIAQTGLKSSQRFIYCGRIVTVKQIEAGAHVE